MTTKKTNDVGQDQVQDAVDIETEQGFRGTQVDPTPDSAYSVAGVNKDAPTPETDDDAAAKADGAGDA
jgi:hypothetical protein